MSIKIIHTADNHIGISYNSVSQAKSELVTERLAALKRIVDEGNKEGANYLVIAGDLFDVTKVVKTRIMEVIKVLKTFNEKVIIIPGNHDFFVDEFDSLWNYFKTNIDTEKIIVLDKYEVFIDHVGEQETRFYPAACRTLHSEQNMIGWVNLEEKPTNSINIGIAHGNVEGLGRDDDGKYFNMTHSELTNSGLDLWLLGHIHVAYPTQNEVNENPGYFMSGTHMPDSWKSTNAGNAWIIEIHEDKKVKAKKFQPSAFNYKVIESDIRSIADIDNFKNQLLNCDKKNTALRLNLTGTLVHNDLSYLEETINEIRNEFIHFEENKYIKRRIDLDAINSEFVEGSLPHILLSELLLEDPDGMSTQKAFEAIKKNN